ncbi:MAG: hypothetical protein BZ135_07870 [Methanosphaera sp. rholeuAM6]|nr:MAG: hypothetical protein BZ135_07870 [Methanosphaera sp. rholeuAM6]
MNKILKVCVVGCGNITNTRHIPALRKLKDVEIVGAISDSQKKIDSTCKNNNIENGLLINGSEDDIELVKNCEWFNDIDAVVIGTPPQQHYPLAKLALTLKKDVLVEKPMTMNEDEANELIELAKENQLIFNVIHNFNYTNGMKKINRIIEEKREEYGDIVSITEIQYTNRNRRLPTWYNELPLGLFYDEAAHFIYLLKRHGGEIKIEDSHAIYNEDEADSTPRILSVDALAGEVPVHMFLNFNSPVCEWNYIICFENRIIDYDLFKDIVVDIPTDKEHYAKEVLKNDVSQTCQYWGQFIKNGFKMFTGNLLYGHEDILEKFITAVRTRESDEYMTGEYGKSTIVTMNEIVEKTNKRD